MIIARGEALGIGQSLLELCCQLVKTHGVAPNMMDLACGQYQMFLKCGRFGRFQWWTQQSFGV
jgi:hypothetical protein